MPDSKQITAHNPQAVQQARAYADALFDSIGDGAIATDAAGRISRINKAALDILGCSNDEVIGQWFPKVIVAVNENGENLEPINRPITQAFLTGKAVSERTIYRIKSGETVPVFVTVSPILMDGSPIGAIEVFRDISVEYEVDRMKSEFISLASHQLRTPLSAINTYAGMLAGGYKGELSAGQLQYTEVILSSANRMNSLITTLLDISKLEAGKVGVQLSEVRLEQLIQKLADEFSPLLQDKNIRLKLSLPQKPTVVHCDRLLVGEVFSNLLSNAIKYTPAKGTITVKLRSIKKEVIFEISDTGYGIPPAAKERIFTKFYRADNIRDKDTTGTGLGLYLVQKITQILGGRVWFESKEGAGTTFFFALRLETVR